MHGEPAGWSARPPRPRTRPRRLHVQVPVPTERHAGILGRLLQEERASANHTSDAHLAALAIEWGLELQSADRDFARYPGLRWRDPLSS